ncbi:MAG: hypothetical protein AAGF88_01255 [Pseudomonadota bacterium]
MRRRIVAFVAAGFLAAPVQGEEDRFTWQGELFFDATIPVPGGTLGTLLAEIAGQNTLDGRMAVSGQITYEDTTERAAFNANVAGFRGAVVEMNLQFGVVPLVADLPRIADHAETSDIGVLAFDNGAFCSDTEHCNALGVVGPSWGNMMLLHNSTGHFFIDETGTTNQFGDLFGAAVGRTDAPADFLPRIETQDHGIVAVDGVYVALFPAPNREFFATHDRLPPIETFQEPDLIGRTEIAIFLELPDGSDPLRIEGIVHAVDILP